MVPLELIKPLKEESIYRWFLDKKGEGLHHLGFVVTDLEGELAKLESTGIGILMRGEFFAYFDTQEIAGVIFELVDRRLAERMNSS